MGEKFNKFKGNLKIILKNIGNSASKTLENLDKSEKEIMKKVDDSIKIQ